MSLGSRIRKIRNLRGFTQKAMAEKLDMTEANFSSYERDKSAPPSDKLNKIASILRVRPDYLLGLTEDMALEDPYSLTPKEEMDIAVQLEKMMKNLESGASIAFHGEQVEYDEEDREALRISLENTLRLSKYAAKKKFTPKKYQK